MADPSSFFPLSFVYNNGNNNLLYDVSEYSNNINYSNPPPPPPLYSNSYFNHNTTPNFHLPIDKSFCSNTYTTSPPAQTVPSQSVWFDPQQQVSYVYSPFPVVWFVKNEEPTHSRESEVPRTPSPSITPSCSTTASASSSPVPSPIPSTPTLVSDKKEKEESCIMLREVLTDELLKLPQATVAEKLGINSSSFSKKWKREFPGKSWPHRKHKKIDIQLQMLYNRLPYVNTGKEREEIEHLKLILEEKMKKNLRRPYEDKDETSGATKAEKHHKKMKVPSASSTPSSIPSKGTTQQRVVKRRRVDVHFAGACLEPTL